MVQCNLSKLDKQHHMIQCNLSKLDKQHHMVIRYSVTSLNWTNNIT